MCQRRYVLTSSRLLSWSSFANALKNSGSVTLKVRAFARPRTLR